MPDGKNDPLVFKNAYLIDGLGGEPVAGAAVVVEGERIAEVLDHPPGALPASARVVDCQGRTLMPGLIDAHVHLTCMEADLGPLMRTNPVSLLVIRALKIMGQALDQGFTTVRDCGGADAGMRMAVDLGHAVGPRLSVAGRHLSMTGGHGDGRWPAELHPPLDSPGGIAGIVADGVEACRLAARDQLRQGVDFIKVMAGGGCMSPADKIDSSQYSLEELAAVVWEADSAGTYVSAHCYSDRSIENSLAAGIKSIEHGNLMSERVAAKLKEAGAWLVPTMAAYEIAWSQGDELGLPREFLDKIGEARERAEDSLTWALKAGCTIGSGSDLLGVQTQKALELELQARVMGPMGAIVAATAVNAGIVGREGLTGTVSPGGLADLIVVEGDPLEDITVLQDYETKIKAVVKGGEFHKRADL